MLDIKKQVQSFNLWLEEGVSAFNSGDVSTYQSILESTSRYLAGLCQSGLAELALLLEPSWYTSLVKKVESDDHYAASFRHHAPALWSAGRLLSPGPILSGVPNCIAFIAQNSVLLGHTEVMLLVMEDWRRRYPQLRILFVGLTPCQPDLARRLDTLEIEALIPETNLWPVELANWLRQVLAAENAGTAVWLSVPFWAPFLFGYRVAKRQVFWSLKFHAVHLGDEVVHIGMTKKRDGTVDIHGKPWLAFQPPLAVSIQERDTATRASMRGVYHNKFLFGTLAREEKFNSPRFAAAVARILKRCPSSTFMFTGREISPVLERALVEHDVAEQAVFIGWVDTELYANLIDCFLETFPFGCGVTGMQALSHGTPVISLWDTDTLPTFYFEDESQASRFHPNWHVSTDEEVYIDAAVERFERWRQGEQRIPISRETITSLDGAKYEQFFNLVTGVCS
jgi:glycosyltransferase involved in cell wall biosynthesis